jgi:hypothetical protein
VLCLVLSAAILLLAGCAAQQGGASGDPAGLTAREAGKVAAALKGLTPGQPVTCIDQSRIRDTRKFTNTILYQYSPREIYRVTTTPGCTGLRYGDIIVSRTTTDQLCRGDIIRTAAPNGAGPTGTCALGSFVPYRR